MCIHPVGDDIYPVFRNAERSQTARNEIGHGDYLRSGTQQILVAVKCSSSDVSDERYSPFPSLMDKRRSRIAIAVNTLRVYSVQHSGGKPIGRGRRRGAWDRRQMEIPVGTNNLTARFSEVLCQESFKTNNGGLLKLKPGHTVHQAAKRLLGARIHRPGCKVQDFRLTRVSGRNTREAHQRIELRCW